MLALIPRVDPGIVFLDRDSLRRRKIVFQKRLLAIGVDPDESNRSIPVFFSGLTSRFIRSYHERTMIAGEEKNEKPAAREITQAVVLSVGCRQIKTRSELTNVQGESILLGRVAEKRVFDLLQWIGE